ncbi:Ltp family lipoprotein [Lentilactobacillus sp. Marseille-Q4993]|uniref:Ltp family lipoprotein n=1 Tax=Lentilactobacillus sp. Marseille-Q4993 TaxID=3039492 RepID=UPI0024BC3C14|nr:Ltp family lipoprotein [Lentilactobacillus sp. Marseille-Q4993]
MKKVLILGVTLLTGLTLTACGSTSSSSSTDDKSSSSTTQVAKSSQESSNETKVPAEYQVAHEKAENYANTMYMSKRGVYAQLTSQAEGFKAKPALWAVRHLTDVDWNANALQKAKDYQKQQSMSSSAIYNQLTSNYGEKFTPAQAKYAIQHLNN